MLPELNNLIQILPGLLGMSEWLLFNVNSAIFSYIMARTSQFSGPLCTRPTRLVAFL